MFFILTGGTIDSYYDTDKCTAIPFNGSIIKNYLEKTVQRDCHKDKFVQICMKDSREIDQSDRDKICDLINNSSKKKFVITHGTYTLFDTAKFLNENIKRSDVVVTLTGSLIPLSGFAPTDAPYNLAYAIANSEFNHPGIYVSIKGKVYPAKEKIVLHLLRDSIE